MMESMSRFGRGIGRHPMPIPHSEDSETDEYNVIDSDRQYERIGDRGSSSTGTSSSRSSNNGALVDPLIGPNSHLHNSHMFHQRPNMATLGKAHPHGPLTTHYAESAIYRRSRGIGSPVDPEPPLIPESQLFMAGQIVNGVNPVNMMDVGWKSQHSTLEFGHLNQMHQQHNPQSQSQNTTILSTLDSTTNTSNATTTTSVHAANMAPVYESCLMRTASGSLYIPSDNKGAFLAQKPLQSINEFTIGGTLKKPDRLPQVGANHSHFGRPLGSHLTGSRFAFRKVLSLQCNWKYIAIAFILITMALVIAITYIMSSALSVASMAQTPNCDPVVVDNVFTNELPRPPQHQTGPGNGHFPLGDYMLTGNKSKSGDGPRIGRKLLALHGTLQVHDPTNDESVERLALATSTEPSTNTLHELTTDTNTNTVDTTVNPARLEDIQVANETIGHLPTNRSQATEWSTSEYGIRTEKPFEASAQSYGTNESGQIGSDSSHLEVTNSGVNGTERYLNDNQFVAHNRFASSPVDARWRQSEHSLTKRDHKQIESHTNRAVANGDMSSVINYPSPLLVVKFVKLNHSDPIEIVDRYGQNSSDVPPQSIFSRSRDWKDPNLSLDGNNSASVVVPLPGYVTGSVNRDFANYSLGPVDSERKSTAEKVQCKNNLDCLSFDQGNALELAVVDYGENEMQSQVTTSATIHYRDGLHPKEDLEWAKTESTLLINTIGDGHWNYTWTDENSVQSSEETTTGPELERIKQDNVRIGHNGNDLSASTNGTNLSIANDSNCDSAGNVINSIVLQVHQQPNYVTSTRASHFLPNNLNWPYASDAIDPIDQLHSKQSLPNASTLTVRDRLVARSGHQSMSNWLRYRDHMAQKPNLIETIYAAMRNKQSHSAKTDLTQWSLIRYLSQKLSQQRRNQRRLVMSSLMALMQSALENDTDDDDYVQMIVRTLSPLTSSERLQPNVVNGSTSSRSARSKPTVLTESVSTNNDLERDLHELHLTNTNTYDELNGNFIDHVQDQSNLMGDLSVRATQTIPGHPHVPLPASSAPFTNIQQLARIYSQRVPSMGYWHLRYHQSEASLVRFNVSFPATATLVSNPVLAIYGNRDKPATHTRYDFVEFAGRVVIPGSSVRAKRANDHLGHHMKVTSIQKEFTKYLDSGVWFFTVYNDAPTHVDISMDLTLANEESCPFNCHGHGVCIAGQCKCDTGYNGESCDLMTCPVLCSGRGQYLNGECVCNSGWKGKECHLRDDECEVSNCNGHGDCVDGNCQCFTGYKGEHCEHVDCLDPKCSGHGHCMSGVCMCGKGWKGADCSEPDTEAMHCLPDCSGHGNFDLQLQQCICDERWTGSDCSQERCDLDCGTNGHCEGGECICDEGWSGDKCMTRLCDPRCLEHGQCQNGTCICAKGWNGKHCSLEGCSNGCSGHGECIRQALELGEQEEWTCVCENGFSGLDCSVPLESKCGDNIDNDKDGLVDCADPECCQSKECEGKQLCFSASDPQDILLRKQPPAMTASFYQRMQFLIEEESVQSYAHKMAFNDSRASVIRGQIMDFGGQGITGVRVGVSTDPMLGFTLTRENGWFDLMVNGGGSITLHLQREPFKPVQKVVYVPVNEIVVLDKIVLSLDGLATLEHSQDSKKSSLCSDHDYDKMRPIVVANWKQQFLNGHSADKSAIIAESQIVQEAVRIPETGINLVYHSSRSNGFLSTIELQLTPEKIEPSLRLVHLKIAMEGILFEKTFEADPNILFTYAWNRRNVYRQKVYGLANAVIRVGYQYVNCASTIWEVQTVQLAGHDMPISEIGGWNLDVHHRYNFHEGILQKGDGNNVYLKQKAKLLTTSIGDGQQRPLHCPYCNGVAKDQRLLAPVALASGPDGSLYIGDFNLVRRLKPDGSISTVIELSESSVAYKYHLTVGPVDGKLYFSDPEKHQILRAINLESPTEPRTNLEVFVGTGVKCLPGDRSACGDGRSARDAKLSYPKGISIAPTGELYIADGTNIRMVDTFGVIHTLIGDHFHKSHWKPIPCAGSTPISKLTLRWPTQLAISPLDQTLHILDDHMVLKVTSDKRVIIVAGRPSHCPSYGHHRHANEAEDKKEITDSKDPQATQVFLETPQSIAFGPNGDLYIAESDSQNTNRVRIVSVGDQRISRFAGADINCSCMDIACQCFSPDDLLAVNARLSTISSIGVTPDGRVHISDQENLRVRTVYSPLPPQNPTTGEYEIVWPDTSEVYVFNRYGQHIMTKSALTGTLLYTFAYNVNTINGRVSSVTDAAGNKVYVLRDYSNQVKSIENSQGDKCRLSMTRQGLLASFTTPSNYAIKFNYHGNTEALLTSRTDSWGHSVLYKYDEYGRVIQAVLPTGDVLNIHNRLAFDGTKKMIITYNDKDLMRLDVSDKEISKYITNGDEVFTLERLGLVTPSSKGSQRKLAIRKRDTSHLEIESLNSPVIADSWSKMSELWPLPSMMRIVYNTENVRRIEWRYFVKRNSANSKPTSSPDSSKKPTLSSIGRKLKLNGNTIFSVEYDKEARQQTIFDHSNRPILHMVYDSVGRPIKFISNFNLTPVALDYDRFGRLLSWTRGSLSLNMEYDIKGRVIHVKHADTSGTVFKYADTTLGPTEIIRPSGSRYLLQYDANGGLTAVMTPAGHRYELYRQVSLGFYKLLFLPSGFHHPFTVQYDEWGRVVSRLLPNNSGRKVIIYNSFGQIEIELCGAEKTEYIYHLGSELPKTINKATSDIFDYRVDYRHQGSLLKEERFRFNSRSELSNYKLRYKYDGVGHINEVEFELQGRGVETKKLKLSSNTGTEEGIDSFIFKRHSANVIQIGDERLLKTIATDSYGRVVGITFSVWNKELFSQVIHYEHRRSRISESRLKYGANYMQSNYSYTLDGSLEQISTVGTQGSPSVPTTLKAKYIYDIDGNIKSIYEGETQLNVRRDDAGRTRSIGEGTDDLYAVDERGFIISRGPTKFIWNANGQLTGVFMKEGSVETTISYHYDHKDRLLSRFVSTSGIMNRTQFVYEESNPSGISYCVIDSRIIGFTYDSNGHLIALSIEGTKYYVASDHLGSPVAVYTSDGVLVKEIIRNVWGKVVRDSNPSFWLPVDFRGSIRDPLTGLNHFADGRVYDSSIGQWLTPNLNAFSQDIQNMVHLYRFFNNDPINQDNFIHNFDGDYGLLPMADMNSWLHTLGYKLDYIFGQLRQPIRNKMDFQSSPILTSLSEETRNLLSQFTHLSMIPESKIKVPIVSNGRVSFLQMHEMSIATLPSTLSAVLISRTPKMTNVYSVENDKNPMINSVLTSVFNGTSSLPFHLVHHSKDEFFFVHQQSDAHQKMQRDIEQLHKLGSLVNVSRVTDNDSQGSSSSASHILISSGNLLLNIRYGVTYDEEVNRVARIARRKAVQEAWQREVYYLRHGHPGMTKFDWSPEEKKSLLHSGMVREYFGSDIHGIERYPQLADDPTNVRFKRDSSNVLNRKRRNHLRRQKSHLDLF